MEKSLIRHGDSLALVIDNSILETLQITVDTKLELTTNGDAIIVTPVRDKKQQARIKESLKKINEKYNADLKRLAE